MNKIIEPTHDFTTIQMHESAFFKIIHDRLGLMIHTHQMHDVYKTIKHACDKFHCTPYEYLKLLKSSPDDSPIFEELITGITIGETYFFRDQNQMDLLKNQILPKIILHKRNNKNLSLRIWSAGCSSGEEIYTIAILLNELIIDLPRWNLQLLGTDINTASLKKAMLASYTEWSMRSISNDYKNRYFTKADHLYLLVPRIRDMVNISYLNLTDHALTSMFNETNAQDLILCRNVLIYFDNDIITELMDKFSQCLAENGFLMLGASDPFITKNTNLVYEYKLGALFHANDKKILLKNIPTFVPPPEIPKTISPMTTHTPTKKEEKNEDVKKVIMQLLDEGEWEKTIATIEKFEKNNACTPFTLLSKGVSLANLGKINEAVFFCHESLKLDPTNTHAYFIIAMTLSELNRLDEAESALRKAIFIDNQYVIGHYQLGLLLLKNNKDALGLKSLRNALAIANAKDPEAPVPHFTGLTYGNLSETFARELEIHKSRKGKQHENQNKAALTK
jgi:chemotaxis protein methyltransferase CheR